MTRDLAGAVELPPDDLAYRLRYCREFLYRHECLTDRESEQVKQRIDSRISKLRRKERRGT